MVDGRAEMSAVRIQVVVPENRQLTITLPAQVAPGAAELIVLTPVGNLAAGATALLDLVDAWRAEHTHRRSQGEIDRYLMEERDTWAKGGEGLPR